MKVLGAAALGILYLGGATGLFAANFAPFKFVFDESGNATYIDPSGPTTGFYPSNQTSGAGIFFTEADPLGGLSTNVLVYDLPGTTWSGTVEVLEPDSSVGDVLWFTNANSVSDGGFDANLMIYYSGDTAEHLLADSGLPTTLTHTLGIVQENANGTFQYLPAQDGAQAFPNGIEFDGTSDTPEPGSVSMLVLGAVSLGIGSLRRRSRG